MTEQNVWIKLYVAGIEQPSTFEIYDVIRNVSHLKKKIKEEETVKLQHIDASDLEVYPQGTIVSFHRELNVVVDDTQIIGPREIVSKILSGQDTLIAVCKKRQPSPQHPSQQPLPSQPMIGASNFPRIEKIPPSQVAPSGLEEQPSFVRNVQQFSKDRVFLKRDLENASDVESKRVKVFHPVENSAWYLGSCDENLFVRKIVNDMGRMILEKIQWYFNEGGKNVVKSILYVISGASGIGKSWSINAFLNDILATNSLSIV